MAIEEEFAELKGRVVELENRLGARREPQVVFTQDEMEAYERVRRALTGQPAAISAEDIVAYRSVLRTLWPPSMLLCGTMLCIQPLCLVLGQYPLVPNIEDVRRFAGLGE